MLVRNDIVKLGQTVRCPLCNGKHSLKKDKKGHAYFSCPDVGGGTNIFPRTPLGKKKLEEWLSEAPDNTTPADVHKDEVASDVEHRGPEVLPDNEGEEGALARYLKKLEARNRARTARRQSP